VFVYQCGSIAFFEARCNLLCWCHAGEKGSLTLPQPVLRRAGGERKRESNPSNEDRTSESYGSALALTLTVLNATALTESAADPVVTKYYFLVLSKTGANRVAMDR
jgi:hypothetical protein